MTAEKKKYEFMRIIALDGSTIYRSKCLTALKDGKTNALAFSGILDDSLETIKLREIYAKHEAEIGYPYLEDKAFCRAIVSVSFDYAIKQYEKQGRRYVLYGQTVTDEDMTDHVCIRTLDGKPTLVAIETPLNQDRHYASVEHPISAELLGKYFVYDAEKHEYKRSDKEMPSVVKKEKIREHLYLHGFDIDGIHYVRYKRSAGSSRDGRCLFIAEPLYQDMMKWSSCGLSADSVLDQASWQAYIALTLSSIESTIRLPKKAILIIPDKVSRFTTKAVCVKEDKALGLTAVEEETEIENVIWDGEALLDVSEFERAGYAGKGMMLLRNRFFKTCAFNTNLQKWFKDKGITTVGQLAGYTTARKVEDIKLVITESSLKYLKFMPKGQSLKLSLEAWLDAIYGGKTTSEFGVVKTDKPPSNMEGRLAYTNYQLMNTLAITPSGMEQLLDASLYHLYKIYASAMHLRYQINYLSETEPDNLAVMTADNYRRKVVMEMLFRTPEFEHTEFYKDLKTDVVYYFKRRLKKGRVLVNGNNQTIFGNPYEFLCAVTDKAYEPTEPMLLGDGEVYTKRFEDGEMLTCARNPHITLGNILIGVNRRKEEIDTYFNLTRDIVCANAINSNLQQRLNGCDYDSDSMLVTNDQFLYLSAKTCYENMGVPVCCVAPVGKAEYSSSAVDLARLDLAIAENKIGDIVNLSQFLNSLLWHNVSNGASINDILPIYNEICILAVLSGMEIDKAKRMYAVKTGKVLHRLEKRKQEFKKANGGKLPNFYYFITGQEEKIEKNNTATLNCPMSIIYDFITKYEPYRLPKRKVKLSDLFTLDESDGDSNDYHRKKNIIVAVQKADEDIRHEKYKNIIAKVVAEIKNGDHAVSPELVMKMQLFSEKLEKHKGKKVYGYLPKETKALVNEIVKMLGNDPQLSEVYDAWYGYKCETVRTYTDTMPDKIPIEENEEFKSIRNAVVSAVRDINTPPDQPDYAVDHDYSKLKEHADDFDYLYRYANAYDDPIGYYRLGRYYLEKTDDMENAEWWLRMAADEGNSLSAYLIYKAYRDHKFDETPSDMMKYLRMAADAKFGYAEYEYAKYLRDKSPEDAKEYLRRAAEHGSFQAEYAYGKMLFEEGRRDEARAYFERSATDDAWTQTSVGLLLYYQYEDYEAGKEYMNSAAEQGYEPAKEAIRAIEHNLNAQIIIGVCDLFYYASNIIDDRAEDMYAKEHQVNYHGIDKKQRREIRAKKQAQGHSLTW